jgi:hypothetical protein
VSPPAGGSGPPPEKCWFSAGLRKHLRVSEVRFHQLVVVLVVVVLVLVVLLLVVLVVVLISSRFLMH